MLRWMVLGLVLCLPSCGFLSYELSRVEVGNPLQLDSYPSLVEGETTFGEALELVGPPDEIRIGWEPDGRQFTQVFFHYQKRRSSNIKVQLPFREVLAYNSGARFFLEFFRVLRGDPTVLNEAQDVSFQPGNRVGAAFQNQGPGADVVGGTKLERDSGRARRLSDERESAAFAGDRGPITPLDPLEVEGAAQGFDLLMLVFDDDGILVRKSLRIGTPRTDFVGQMSGSLLQ
ncbi:MAG: hypothetical protein RL885_27810 [Planctomycetota bacterium]